METVKHDLFHCQLQYFLYQIDTGESFPTPWQAKAIIETMTPSLRHDLGSESCLFRDLIALVEREIASAESGLFRIRAIWEEEEERICRKPATSWTM
jgi:hypothetical protein